MPTILPTSLYRCSNCCRPHFPAVKPTRAFVVLPTRAFAVSGHSWSRPHGHSWSRPHGHSWSRPHGHSWSRPHGHSWSRPHGHSWSRPHGLNVDLTFAHAPEDIARLHRIPGYFQPEMRRKTHHAHTDSLPSTTCHMYSCFPVVDVRRERERASLVRVFYIRSERLDIILICQESNFRTSYFVRRRK